MESCKLKVESILKVNKGISDYVNKFITLANARELASVRETHDTNLLPYSPVLDFFHAPKVSPNELRSVGSISSLSGTSAVQKSAIHLFTSRKRFAFTLAEVLITLAIIGVVAAMTMPVLIGKYQEHVTVN